MNFLLSLTAMILFTFGCGDRSEPGGNNNQGPALEKMYPPNHPGLSYTYPGATLADPSRTEAPLANTQSNRLLRFWLEIQRKNVSELSDGRIGVFHDGKTTRSKLTVHKVYFEFSKFSPKARCRFAFKKPFSSKQAMTRNEYTFGKNSRTIRFDIIEGHELFNYANTGTKTYTVKLRCRMPKHFEDEITIRTNPAFYSDSGDNGGGNRSPIGL